MKLSDFDYPLPEELIAARPLPQRSASRLLVLDRTTGDIAHRHFTDIVDYLEVDDLMVLNNTRVIPARLFGHKETGGQVEILVERVLSAQRMLVQIKGSKRLHVGSKLALSPTDMLEVVTKYDGFVELKTLNDEDLLTTIARHGQMPLPPYIKRQAEQLDLERYQTVFAKDPGAVAAPTAGLHFDDALLNQLKYQGVKQAFVTLHVGAGTFQPVRVDDIEDHQMHSEYMVVDQSVCDLVSDTKQQSGRVLAVGTTSLRALESASRAGQCQPFIGDTDIFIYPGFQFHCVDALITNFHLPKSTLLMLVSAFAGRENIQVAYQEAIEQRYRFFSYGDAMLIL